jgi:hypothetical protein
MSDYIPKDPLGPISDRNGGPVIGPNDPRGYDQYGNTRFEPANDTGKGPYILLGLLVAIGMIGGLLYFNGSPKTDNMAQAPATPAIERTTPLPSAAPGAPGTPITPMTPAPTTAPASPATQAPNGGTAQQ